MRPHAELANEVAYLEALCALLLYDGEFSTDQFALAEPFTAILAAVAQASREKQVVE